MGRMGRVIGGDSVHRAVGQSHEQCFAIRCGAQRGIHFEVGVILADIFVDQREVMWSDFAGDARTAALTATDRLQRVGGREMSDVQPRSGELLGQLHIAFDD